MPVEAGCEVVDRLRRQTQHWPKKIEACHLHRSIVEGKATREGYIALLEKMWAFVYSFESQVENRREWDGFAFELGERKKLSNLEKDLHHFGRPIPASNQLFLPLDEVSFAFVCGYLYVLESATMVGQNQYRILSRKLGISASEGGAYLTSYGDRAGRMWRQCQDFLERVGMSRFGAANEMVEGANDAYLRLEAWLKADA